MFICHGAGANGKSLLLETIREVVGTYGQTVPVTALMSGKSNSGGANPEIARLRGVRFALASETEKGQRWSANRIKQLTGGDTVAARALYKDVSEFKSKATIWVDQRNQELLVEGLSRALNLEAEERIGKGLSQRRRAEEAWSRGLSLRSWRGLLSI